MQYIKQFIVIALLASICFFVVLPIFTIIDPINILLSPENTFTFLASGFFRYSLIGIIIAFALALCYKEKVISMTIYTSIYFIFMYGIYILYKITFNPLYFKSSYAIILFMSNSAFLLISSITTATFCKSRGYAC